MVKLRVILSQNDKTLRITQSNLNSNNKISIKQLNKLFYIKHSSKHGVRNAQIENIINL